MEPRENPFFLEMVDYQVDTGPSLQVPRVRMRVPARRRGITYFFNRVIGHNERDFEPVNIEKQISSTIKKYVKNLFENLREKINKLIPSTELLDALIPSPERSGSIEFIEEYVPPEYYFHKHTSSIILPLTVSSFCIISKTRDEASQLIEFIKSEFEKLSDVTKDFGLRLSDFRTGRNYQESILKNTKHIQNINYKEPKNEFEKEVVTFCEQLTSSFLPNVEIAFAEPNETYEYDIFVGITSNVKRILEPTDYELVKEQLPSGENLKSQIILKTLDKAQRLGAKSAVIAKGFPEDTFYELKKIAESRGVILIDENNYKDIIPKMLLNDVLNAFRQLGEPEYVRLFLER